MNKFSLFIIFCFSLLNLFCNDPYYFSNPLASQSNVILQAPKILQVDSITENIVVLRFEDANTFSHYPNTNLDYEIEQSSDSSNYTKVRSAQFSDKQVTVSGTFLSTLTYYFRIRAKAANTISGYSNVVSANLSFPTPCNLAMNISNETKATLSWTNTNSLATTVIIEKSNNGINYFVVDSIAATATIKDVAGIYSSDTTYYFRIGYKSTVNQSAYTVAASQKLRFPAPSNFTFTFTSDIIAKLTWTNTNSLATTVIIEESNDGINYTFVDSTVATATTKDITTIYKSDTTYYFRIEYRSKANKSAYTSQVSKKLRFPAPSNFTFTFTSDVIAKLTWTNTNSLATTVIIEKSNDGINYAFVDNTVATATTKDITSIYKSDTTYYFRIKYRSNVNQSAYTSPVSQKLRFPAPSNFTFTFTSDVIAKLAWTNTNSLATTVIIEKSNDGINYAFVDSTVAIATTKDITSIYKSDTTYYFRIKYRSNVNQSAYTSPVSQKLSFSEPMNLQVTAITETAVTLRWQNSNSMATRIVIEQSANSRSRFVVLDSAGIVTNITSRTIGGNYSKDTTYYFRLQAKSNINKSIYSNVASGHITYPREKIHQVYCLGNSITHNGTYEFQLNVLLGSEWYVNNEGINGNITAQMYARLNKDILDLGDAEYVVVMGGVNDVAKNIHADQIETNLQSIYTTIHNASAKIVAVTITPFKGCAVWSVMKQASLDSVNTWILNTATNVDYRVNVYTVLEDPNNADQLLPEYNSDWVHLSRVGYLKLGTTIYNGVTWTK
jgi:lysophospholipase L1-like esterase/negative regulator of genetic competence, sporulation and motility